jgi:hypothetical protein
MILRFAAANACFWGAMGALFPDLPGLQRSVGGVLLFWAVLFAIAAIRKADADSGVPIAEEKP